MTTYPRRPARVMPWSRAGLSQPDAPTPASTIRDDDRWSPPETDRGRPPIEPGWLLELKNDVTRSVFTIERVADRVGSMRDDTQYFRTLAGALRKELDMERAQASQRLVAQGQSMSKQQQKTAAAEACADNLAGVLLELEQQLTSCRAQTERLVDAVDHVVDHVIDYLGTTDADQAEPHRLHG